jgi:hypothetical protein
MEDGKWKRSVGRLKGEHRLGNAKKAAGKRKKGGERATGGFPGGEKQNCSTEGKPIKCGPLTSFAVHGFLQFHAPACRHA